MKKILSILVSLAVACNVKSQSCAPTDNSFGINGLSFGQLASYYLTQANIIVLPDNNVLQFGANSFNGITTLKYKSSGSLDSSFGVNGKASITFGSYSVGTYGAVQSDGKIVVAGTFVGPNGNKIGVVRFNSNGTPDVTFGTNGALVTPVGTQHDGANGVAIQADGKIVVVGYASNGCFTDCLGHNFCRPYFTVLRYKTNGTLDSTFGQTGIVSFGVGQFNSGSAMSAIIQADGKIVVAGESLQYYCDDYYGGGTYSSGFFMTRLNSDGTIDASFGQNGQVRDSVDVVNTVAFAMQPDGKFVVLGSNISGYKVKRFTSNGAADNTFDNSVVFNNWMMSMALAPDGKIVVGGQTYVNGNQEFYIARLKNNGGYDSTLNLSGRVIIPIAASNVNDVRLAGIAIQGNKIIGGGGYATYVSPTYTFTQLLLRLPEPLTGLPAFITPSGNLFPCQGNSVTLTCNQNGSFQWYKNNVLMQGVTTQSYQATTSGSYSVKVTNAAGCGLSDPVVVSVDGLPVTITPASSTTLCQGDSVKLVSNHAAPIQWTLNGIPIANATDSVYWAKAQGDYRVTVNNSVGCGKSGNLYVTVNPARPLVSWNGTLLSTTTGYSNYHWYKNGVEIPGAFTPNYQPSTTGLYKVTIGNYPCNNESTEFYLSCAVISVSKPAISWNASQLSVPNSYTAYQWYRNNVPISNATNYFTNISQIGTYKVEVTGQMGCTVTSNDFVLTCAEAGPAQPAINWNGTSFSTNTGYPGYQWYLNDTAIVGANAFFYTPAAGKFGRYKVEVTNAFSCSNFSEERFYSPTDIITLGQARFTYYPNPVSGTFYIDVMPSTLKNMTAVLYDLHGKKVFTQTLKSGQNQLDVKGLPSGLYHLEVMYGNERSTLKLAVLQ